MQGVSPRTEAARAQGQEHPMKSSKLPKPRDLVKEERVGELLWICTAFKNHNRKIPGHVQRELALLSAHWGKNEIPPEIIEAKRLLESTR
jgi:hypothetical protein